MKDMMLWQIEKIEDDLYYLKDILSVGATCLSRIITWKILKLLILPNVFPSSLSSQNIDSYLSTLTSLYIFSRVQQIVDHEELANSIGIAMFYPQILLNVPDTEGVESGLTPYELFLKHAKGNEVHTGAAASFESGGTISIGWKLLFRDANDITISPENCNLLLASLLFLFILTESKGLDCMLFTRMGSGSPHSYEFEGNTFVLRTPQIVHALLKFLESHILLPVTTLRNILWNLRRLLIYQERKLTAQEFDILNFNYERSREMLLKELDGCWFDLLPFSLMNEWERCKTALEEPSQMKDPIFVLELALPICLPDDSSDLSSTLSWSRMIYRLEVFLLYYMLRAFALIGDIPENPLLGSSVNISRGKYRRKTNLETEFTGSEIPCRITFSENKGIDVSFIPVVEGISGELFLLEKHRTNRNVLSVAPLAGLEPTIDSNHLTWLHLRIRNWDPKYDQDHRRLHNALYDEEIDGRWTVGFSTSEDCESARMLILREIEKQRYAVKNLLTPLIQNFQS